MTGQIKMVNMQCIAKSINFNSIQIKDIGQDKCTISFELENYKENTPLFITLNNMTRKEITTAMKKVDTHYEYVLNGLNPESRYSFYLSVKTNANNFLSNIYSFTTTKIPIYGVRVDETNSNPSTCVTYIEDSVGITTATSTSLGGWGSTSLFNKIKLVGFKNGKETGDINPNDKTKYLNGYVPQDVDVMVKIPKVYWDFTNTSNGYELRISESKFNKTCDCYAHKVGGIEKDYIYVGAYLGYVEGNKLRSRSGVSPTTSTTLTNFRNYAHNVGSGYQQWNWFTLLLLQNLYLLAYKNLNSQSALGQGVCNVSNKVNTGGTNTKGMIFGSSNQGQQVCFLGVEDFYGNVWQWVDGMYCDGSYNTKVTPDNRTFNDNGSGFKNVGKFVSSSTGGYVSKVAHTNEGGFFPKEFSGSDTTYYCDYGTVGSGYFGVSGGFWYDGADVGAFDLSVYWGASESDSRLGSRLVFLG